MSQSISQFANQSMNKYVKEYTWRQLKAAVAANLYNRIGLEGTLFCIHVSTVDLKVAYLHVFEQHLKNSSEA